MDVNVLVEFKALSRSLLDGRERQSLQKIITSYKEDEDFYKLVDSLKLIIASPEQRQILPFIKLFLSRKHKHLAHRFSEEEFMLSDTPRGSSINGASYLPDELNESRQDVSNKSWSDKKKTVCSTVIIRKMNESLGIGIRGGIDFGCGIFISDVQPDSPAAKAGLHLGDQILSVNNVSFESITANASARFLASAFPAANGGNVSRLRVLFSRTGMIPAHRTNRERIAWHDVRSGTTVFGAYSSNEETRFIHVAPTAPYYESNALFTEVVVDVHVSLSFAIRGGRDFGLGIFVSAIGQNEADCENAGRIDLRVGDEIVAVNGRDLRPLKHSQAVDYLRQQRHLSLTIKHVGKYPLFKEIASEVTWAAADSSPIISDQAVTTTQSVRNELPWETVVTIRRNSHSRPNTISNAANINGYNDYGMSRQNQAGKSQRSLSFSLTKSSSGSLIIDAANSNQMRNGGSIRSLWSAASAGLCPMNGQPDGDSSVRRRNIQPHRTPISTIQFDEVNGQAKSCRDCQNDRPCTRHRNEFLDGNNSEKYHDGDAEMFGNHTLSQTSFESNQVKLSRTRSHCDSITYSSEYRHHNMPPVPPSASKKASNLRSNFKIDCDIKSLAGKDSSRSSSHKVVFSDEEKSINETGEISTRQVGDDDTKPVPLSSRNSSRSNVNAWLHADVPYVNNSTTKRPSVAVRGKHTTLVKLPKRPDTSLGLGVCGGGDSPDQCLRIDHTLPDSIAGEAVADGLLQPGCLLLAVDGQSLVGSTHEEAVGLIRRCFRDASKSTLNLLVSTCDMPV